MPPPAATNAAAQAAPPGGLSAAAFEAICVDVGEWLWGTARGAFNEKATVPQIVVDAVIGLIPLVGDVTAARDLIAVVMRMIDEPARREDKWEWVLLIVLLFALVPVFGGVIKGVGRLVVKLDEEARPLTEAARAAHLAAGARDIVAFLNRIGHRDAEVWFKGLRIAHYEAQLVKRFQDLLGLINGVLVEVQRKLGPRLSAPFAGRLNWITEKIGPLMTAGERMIPEAVKELDQQLREIQAFVHSGGATTSRKTLHEIAVGERVVTRVEEARLVERHVLPARSPGGWRGNYTDAKNPNSIEKVYKREAGYPNLQATVEGQRYPQIEAFSGAIVNQHLKPGEQISRFFGPEGTTHHTNVGRSYPGGAWWAVGPVPTSAKQLREKAALLDEFNRAEYVVIGTVSGEHEIKAAIGTAAEQRGKKIPGQFLPGGAIQAVIDFDRTFKDELSKIATEVVASGKGVVWTDPVSKIRFDIRPTGWTDANGVWGYMRRPGQTVVQVSRLGSREAARKSNEEVFR